MLASIFLSSVLLQTSACGNSNTDYLRLPVTETIESTTSDFLQANAELSLFVNALRTAGLLSEIGKLGSILILAPTDSALRSQGSAFLLEDLLFAEDVEDRILDSLKLHIADSPVVLTDSNSTAASVVSVTTLGGQIIRLRVFSSKLFVGHRYSGYQNRENKKWHGAVYR